MMQIAILAMALLATSPLWASETNEIEGYHGLYMGHSFFTVCAKELEDFMPDSTVAGHTQAIVGSGGKSGSPRHLWENHKKRTDAQRYLDTSQCDLLVMTYFNHGTSSAQHYARWFDYAIARNPDVALMVTIPWATQLIAADQTKLDEIRAGVDQFFHDVIVPLREAYPKNKVFYCPYGFGTYELIERFRAGELPGVKYISPADKQKNKSKEYLLTDRHGHASELVAKVGALLWLQTLYDYDLTTLSVERIEELPEIDFVEIAATVSEMIKPYNEAYRSE